MKRNKIIFWVSTLLVSALVLMSGINYFINDDFKVAFEHLGFPSYFRIELGIAKILGAIALLVPMVPKFIKQFAYHGFMINFISAAVAHAAVGDPVSTIINPLVALVVLLVSYYFAEGLWPGKQSA